MSTPVVSNLRHPFRAADWPDATFVGTLLVLAAPMALPALFLVGYLVRVVRASESSPVDRPDFDAPAGLLRDGLSVGGVFAAYQLPAVVAGTAALELATRSVGTLGGLSPGIASVAGATRYVGILTTPTLYGPTVVTVAVATGLVGAATAYLGSAAALNTVRADAVAAGFDRGRLHRTATNRSFGVAWLFGSLVVGVAHAVAAAVSAIPVVGALAGAALVFHAACVAVDAVARTV